MKHRLPIALYGVALIAIFSLSSALRATTLMRMSLAQLAASAHEIVRARCLAITTAWDAGEIWTFTTFDVQENWRGSLSGRITVRLLGGKTEKLTSVVSGIPRFRLGEEVVLFLEPTIDGDLSVVSWEQGTFRIGRNIDSGEETVTQDTAAFATFNPRNRRFAFSGVHGMPIADFRAQVGAAVAPSKEDKP